LNEGETPKPTKTKAHNEGEKLTIRRLPPGMTEVEFTSILGSEWEAGKGKVDWFCFAEGKISTEYVAQYFYKTIVMLTCLGAPQNLLDQVALTFML
jgi:hypothetical protein